MPDRTAVIFGAGKIARGFIAHLLTLSGFRISFVEKTPELVSLLRQRQRYTVHVMGAPEKDIVITGFETLSLEDRDVIVERVADAGVTFVSIGGPNLPQIAPLVAAGVRRAAAARRATPLNVILCENYFQPGPWVRSLILEELSDQEKAWFHRSVGIVETLVLRSCVEPTPEMKAYDPLSLRVQDAWELPADRQALVGDIPPIHGIVFKESFQGALVRKLFTYNMINAVIAYSGYLKGYNLLSDAANAPDVLALARAASRESGEALCKTYGFDSEDQERFAESAITKYQKREIVDPIERNARDPLRKLGRHDRLVGPACLSLDAGITPAALSRATAAALLYDEKSDPAAQKIQATIREQGLRKTIQQVCGIHPKGGLADMIIEAYGAWEDSRVSS
jgi:mannitol-1-phosphate 5-dehydrogenase